MKKPRLPIPTDAPSTTIGRRHGHWHSARTQKHLDHERGLLDIRRRAIEAAKQPIRNCVRIRFHRNPPIPWNEDPFEYSAVAVTGIDYYAKPSWWDDLELPLIWHPETNQFLEPHEAAALADEQQNTP